MSNVKKPSRPKPGPVVTRERGVARQEKGMINSPFGADATRTFDPPPTIARPRNGADPSNGFNANQHLDRSGGGKSKSPFQSNETPDD